MNDDFPLRILLPEVVHVDRLEHLVNTAVTFPENQLGPLDRSARIAPIGLKGVPDNHLFFSQTHLVRRIAAQMLVREKEDLLPPCPRPVNHRLGVG
jgi:hypothetical protein